MHHLQCIQIYDVSHRLSESGVLVLAGVMYSILTSYWLSSLIVIFCILPKISFLHYALLNVIPMLKHRGWGNPTLLGTYV